MQESETELINTNNAPIQKEPPLLTREAVLKMLGQCIYQVHHKLKNGRVRDPDKEKLKREMLRCQAYLSQVFFVGLKDLELEQLNERLTKLEDQRGGRP